eukprot:CAMPEP_0184480848 /NCGR_PEP_ID=MMETSP0113_2-20130426/2346_1 /TAXON_ID=91329 /ORGANISM="Norrisiella sphaerica, Strain BC52" /LENGTH=657 /DNA_ID=CAMNT_0026859587 /DNA_START=158 /DNA_END=2131 /DNA_ORIENTATION=-
MVHHHVDRRHVYGHYLPRCKELFSRLTLFTGMAILMLQRWSSSDSMYSIGENLHSSLHPKPLARQSPMPQQSDFCRVLRGFRPFKKSRMSDDKNSRRRRRIGESSNANHGESRSRRLARVEPELVVEPATKRMAGTSVLKSVVKVFCTDVRPNFALPWQMEQQESSFSSGFVISGNRILTNAHGIAWHNVVRVRKHGDSRKFVASVEHVAHECDLAILKVEDPQFWAGLEPLPFGSLPELQDKIMVVGYPHGGDRISITQGIVSRVEMGSYSHSGEYLLMIQIDAAINSGNSGGPALGEDGRVIGVAFQALDEAENIGYIIPVPIIEHFLNDIELHGNYTGFCRLGISWQTTENEAMREYLGLSHLVSETYEDDEADGGQGAAYSQNLRNQDMISIGEDQIEDIFLDSDDTGVLVTHVEPQMPTSKVLKVGDVIAALDGVPIASDGTVPFRGEERVLFSHILRSKFTGDSANITIIRNGEVLEDRIDLKSPPQLVPWYMYDRNPSYLVYSGLVFTPLSVPYLMAEFGHRWQRYAPVGLLEPAMYGVVNDAGEEVVVLTQVLASDATTGYEDINNVRVINFNGKRVTSLRQLLRLIHTNDEPYVRLEVGNSPSTSMQIILNADEAEVVTNEILEQNKIPDCMSAELKRWVEEGMPESQ